MLITMHHWHHLLDPTRHTAVFVIISAS